MGVDNYANFGAINAVPSELLFLLVWGECWGEGVAEWPGEEARDSWAERGVGAGDSREERGGGGGDWAGVLVGELNVNIFRLQLVGEWASSVICEGGERGSVCAWE